MPPMHTHTEANDQQGINYHQGNTTTSGLGQTRCGTNGCAAATIRPDQFLAEPMAVTCWDCPLVWNKIDL